MTDFITKLFNAQLISKKLQKQYTSISCLLWVTRGAHTLYPNWDAHPIWTIVSRAPQALWYSSWPSSVYWISPLSRSVLKAFVVLRLPTEKSFTIGVDYFGPSACSRATTWTHRSCVLRRIPPNRRAKSSSMKAKAFDSIIRPGEFSVNISF